MRPDGSRYSPRSGMTSSSSPSAARAGDRWRCRSSRSEARVAALQRARLGLACDVAVDRRPVDVRAGDALRSPMISVPRCHDDRPYKGEHRRNDGAATSDPCRTYGGGVSARHGSHRGPLSGNRDGSFALDRERDRSAGNRGRAAGKSDRVGVLLRPREHVHPHYGKACHLPAPTRRAQLQVEVHHTVRRPHAAGANRESDRSVHTALPLAPHDLCLPLEYRGSVDRHVSVDNRSRDL